jgi:hypothetical protein
LGLTDLDGFATIHGSYGRDACLFSCHPVRNGIHDQLNGIALYLSLPKQLVRYFYL